MMSISGQPCQVADVIDREHEMLQTFLDELEKLMPCPISKLDCKICPQTTIATCVEQFERYCEHLLTYMQDHFRYEENKMHLLEEDQHFLRDAFESHREAHGDLIQVLSETISMDCNPASGRRSLLSIIDIWLEDHLNTHDAFLLNQLRADSPHSALSQ